MYNKNKEQIVILNGEDLTINEIVAIGVGDAKVELAESALKKCQASRDFLEEEINAKKVIYGVNTSYGPMCNKIISKNNIKQLQINLVLSHAAGLGDPLKPYISRAVLAVRLNTLVKGYSGVTIELLEFMCNMINNDVVPMIPECGSVGASGDLIHLAHMSLAIIGEGNAYYKNELIPADIALKKIGLKPFSLGYKEGIALMNGTAAMTAIAAFAIFGTKKLLNVACVNAAFAIELFGGIDDAFDKDLHQLKPHVGQVKISDILRALYKGSKNINFREDLHDKIRLQEKDGDLVFETNINVQDVYSLRCTPQLLAPVYEALEYAIKIIETEANSSNDNPLIIPEKKKILHGGNFHGQSVSFAMDTLTIAVSTLCNLSERRLNKILDKNLNEGLPEHLIAGTAGLAMGFMGAQYLSTSTTAENRQLASPISVNSISCNASNQDVVSMGTIAARKALKAVTNAKHIITLEMLADMQALSFKNADKMGFATTKLYNVLKEFFEVYDNKRIFHNDLVKFRKLIFSSNIFDDLSVYYGK